MAAFGKRRGRPPHPDLFTPSELRVLELIRAGRTNSEIAYELAISISGVKYHVTNMLAKLGVADRAALAAWSGDQPRTGTTETGRGKLSLLPPLFGSVKLLAAAIGVVAVGAVVAVAFYLSGMHSPGATAAPSAQPAGFPDPLEGYAALTAQDLEALGMVDAGPILRSTGGAPVAAVQIREGMSVVLLTGPAEVFEGPGTPWGAYTMAINPNWAALVGDVVDQPVRVNLWGTAKGISEGTRVSVGPSGQRQVSSSGGGRPELLLQVLDGTTLRPYRSALATNGHLFVSEDPIEGPVVLDRWTGSLLDVSGAVEGHPLPGFREGLFRFTACDWEKSSVCYVSLRTSEPLTAPISGALACATSNELRITTSELEVRVEQVDTGYGSNPKFNCEPHPVTAGQEIGPRSNHWVYTAFTQAGEQISAGVSYDGRFYIGRFEPAVPCPCLTGN